jgi:hypothetical protein
VLDCLRMSANRDPRRQFLSIDSSATTIALPLCVGDVSRHQFVNPIDRMFSDTSEDLTQVSFRIHAVELGRLEKGLRLIAVASSLVTTWASSITKRGA